MNGSPSKALSNDGFSQNWYNSKMKKSTLLITLFLSLFSFAKDSDTLPIKKGAPGQVMDPTDNTLLGKQKTPAQKKKVQDSAAEEDVTAPKNTKPYVASVSTFGSSRLTEVNLRETLGKDLDAWLKMGVNGDDRSVQMEERLAQKVKEKYGFHSAEWSIIQFFEPGDLAIHITMDVVEKQDVAKRMPFQPQPTAEFKDPDGLVKAWADYENTALDLIEAGQIEPESDQCTGVAFHCPFGHKHEKLKKYQTIFVEGVQKNLDKLIEIQTKDKRAEFRGAATYLLAYCKDGQKVTNLMVDRVKDPSDLVRNNALRVLGDVAEFYPQFIIPTAPIVQALNFPRASDRSKSVFVAHLLVLNSQSARDEILKTGVPSLLDLLKAKMPDQKEFAHAILRKISGKDYAATDIPSWNNWYGKLNRGVSSKK